TVQVLEQRISQHVLIGGRPNDRGYLGEACPPARAEAPLTHNQFVARLTRSGSRYALAHDDRLKDAELPGPARHSFESLVIEFGAGLHSVRNVLVESKMRQRRPWHLAKLWACVSRPILVRDLCPRGRLRVRFRGRRLLRNGVREEHVDRALALGG